MDIKTWCSSERGRASKLASAIGVPLSFLSQITKGGRPVPVEHCAAIEEATGREVMRWDLRPDDWQRIWPELTDVAGSPDLAAAQAGQDAPRGDERRGTKPDNRKHDYPIPPELDFRGTKKDRRGGAQGAEQGV